jgi:endonuclease/exonuclease/phosphatase family metal-dependent hydrolase
MNHGKITNEIAKGLVELRRRIAAAKIPSSKLDETLNIATWNIREFGRRRRKDASIHYIAEILGQFDLIAVVELRDNLEDLERTLRILGPYWKAVFSDPIPDPAGNSERLGFIYDKRACTFTGLAAEANAPRKKNPKTNEYESAIQWWRSPYIGSFRAGSFDFIVLSAHIRWGDSDKGRIPELRVLADWVDARAREKFVEDKDILVMGDFNIPKQDDELFRAITSKGLKIPAKLRGTHGSNLAKDKRYDQILHYQNYPDTFANHGGVLDFYCGDWKKLYPGVDMTKEDLTYEMSDHLPLWLQVRTDVEGFRLDQILSRNS